MMRKLQNSRLKNMVWVFSAILLFAACRKDNDSLAPMRMFMPGGFDITSYTTNVLVTWDPSLYTSGTDTSITYTVQVSKDSTFQSTPFLTVTTDTSGVRLTDDTLEVRQKYFARVKANKVGDRPASKWVVSPSFKIQGIQVMLPKETKVQATRVQLHWEVTPGISKIILTADSLHQNDTTHVLVSGDEAANGLIEIKDLIPHTTYHVELYVGKKSVGYDNFTTKNAITGNVVDLSDITGRPGILADTLPDVPSGSVIFLKRGSTYEFSDGYGFEKSVVIMSKPGFGTRAHVKFIGGAALNIEDGSHIDSLVFDELKLSGDFSSNYVFNVSKGGTIGKVVFDECSIRTFRGVFRIKASDPVTITDVVYNNCVIDSINGYGVMNVNNSAATVKNIRVKKTTIINANVMFAGKSAVDSILLDYCTFYNSPADGGRYTVDFDDNVVSYIRVHSCVFGKADGVKGIRAGDGSQIFVSGSYKTADYVSEGYDISGLVLYNQASDKIFKDPGTGDLNIIDPNFPAVGDPRWLP